MLARGNGLPRLLLPGLSRHPRLSGDVSRLRRAPSASGVARDEPRAGDGGPAPDGQVYESLDGPRRRWPYGRDHRRGHPRRSLRRRHHRQRRRRRHHGARARRHRRTDPGARARRLRAAGSRELGSGGGLEAPALPHDRRLARRATATSSRRTRTTASAATRSSGAACCIACGARTSARCSTPTACRRRGRSTTTRSRPTTTGRAALPRARRPATIPPSRRAGRFPYPAVPHAPRMAAIVERAARAGAASVAAAAGPDPAGRDGGCQLCNTCNSFPCRIHAKSDAEVCCVRPALGAAERHAVDRRARASG